MTILAFGTSLAEIVSGLGPPAGLSASTTAARIAPEVSEGIQIEGAVDTRFPKTFAGQTELWTTFYLYWTGSSPPSDGVPLLLQANGQDLFRLDMLNAAITFQYWNSGWTNIGSSISPGINALHRIEMQIIMHDTTGVAKFWINGEEIASLGGGDTIFTSETDIDTVSLSSTTLTGEDTIFSAWIIADEDVRSIVYAQVAIDGNGGETDWTGVSTDVDETGFDDADSIQSSTTTDKETFTFGALPAAYNSGYSVVGVGVSARAIKGSSGPANLQLACRSNAVNGFSGNKALTLILEPHQHVFIVNPDTTNPWSFSESDASEIGVQAIT